MRYLIPFLFLFGACDGVTRVPPRDFKKVGVDGYYTSLKYVQMPDGRPCVVALGHSKGGVSCDWNWKPGVER